MKKFIFLYLLIAAFGFGIQCKKGLTQQTNSEVDEQSGNVNKTLLIRLVNEQRAQGCNCSGTYKKPAAKVKWNDKLELAAQRHCDDMQAQNYFDHTSKDGRKPGERMEEVGYYWLTYGENIANGYADEKAVMAGWIKSDGHCENIMNLEVTEMAVARSSNGRYWTQIFAKPK